MINYNPSLPFNGLDDYIELKENISALSQVTIFTVFKAAHESDKETDIWGLHDEESSIALTTKRAYTPTKELYYSGANTDNPVLHTYIQLFPSRGHAEASNNYVCLGAASKNTTNSFFKGSIAELIAYNRKVSGSDRQKIESALAIKYGITLSNGKNYISSNKKNVWDTENDIHYSNNIAGIGADEESNIYQKQSTSSNAPGNLIIGVGSIAQSNKANTSLIINPATVL